MTGLPSGWSIQTVKDLLPIRYGKSLAANLRVADGKYPVVGSAGEMARTNESLINGPTIIVGRKGNVGAVQLLTEGGWPIDTTYYSEVPVELDPRFVTHQLIALRLVRLDSSTATPSLRRQDYEAQELVVPPLDEQRRIVDILEDHLSRLAAATELLGTTQLRLRALRQSCWSRHFGYQEGVAEPLLSLAEIANGQTPKGLADALESEMSDTAVPFFKVGDMNQSDGRLMASTRSYIRLDDARSLGLHIHPAGTVLFPKRGGAIATNKKRLLSAEGAYDLNIMGLVPGPRIRPTYLWHWLEGIDLAGLADGSNVPQINFPQIRGLSLVAPPLAEQDRLVSVMDSNDQATDCLGWEIDQARARSERLRQALLAAAFSGRLTGRSTDMEMVEEMAGV